MNNINHLPEEFVTLLRDEYGDEEVDELLEKFYERAEPAGLEEILAPKELSPIVKTIKHYFLQGEYDVVDNVISKMDFSTISPYVISVTFRSAVPAKQKLPNWNKNMQRSIDALKKRGYDPDYVMRGLGYDE